MPETTSRKRKADEENAAELQRKRSAVDALADMSEGGVQLMYPVNQRMPVDPVFTSSSSTLGPLPIPSASSTTPTSPLTPKLRDEGTELERARTAVDEAVDALLCPITKALPVDPVVAEDGKIYERKAIKAIAEWHQKHKRTPASNEAIGQRLVPASGIKSMIRKMIETGAISGDKAEAWKEACKEEEAEEAKVEGWRQLVQSGDGMAMAKLGGSYFNGTNGLTKDYAVAFEWFNKSHEADCAAGTAALGRCFFAGLGVKKSELRGLMHLIQAAERGSQWGCYNMGELCQHGRFGLTKNLAEARKYYAKVASATTEDYAAGVEKAAAWLSANPSGSVDL